MSRAVAALAFAAALAGAAPRARAIVQPPHDAAAGIDCVDCHIPYAGLSVPASAEGTAGAGSTATTLVDLGKGWADGEWVDGVVTFTSGANRGQFRTVTANGVTSLAWATPLPAALAAGDAYRLGKTTQYDVETRCKSCHNPTGMAWQTPNVGVHVVRGDTVIGCGKCHEPHNVDPSSGPDDALVRVAVRWPTARATTVYPSGGASPQIVGAAPWNGACETCHTQTAYHRNDASGDHGHNATVPCTNCHGHARGFSMDCVGCHSVGQDDGDGVPAGGRRAVAGEFPAGPHAHFGATLTASACPVCHEQSTHMDGWVDLVDADDAGTVYRFQRPGDLAGDPDLSTFCMRCHDADGAARLAAPFDPFGAGDAPPDVAIRFAGTLQWEEAYGDFCFGNEGSARRVNSHHDIGSADQAWSGAKVECLSCHGAHTPSRAAPASDPFDTTVVWTGTRNEHCLVCHGGGAGPASPAFPPGVVGPTIALRGIDSCGYQAPPWYVFYTWDASAHGAGSKRSWGGYSGAPAAHLDCVTCHDPHGSYTPANPLGNPYAITDFVDGTALVNDGFRPSWLGPPWTTFGAARAVTISISGLDVDWGGPTGLCRACHAGFETEFPHTDCSSCQTCHAHGADWGEYDWVGGDDDTPCPPPP